MKKLAMTGGRGKIGSYLSKLGVVDLECDVTNPLQIQSAIKYQRPNVIIHLAGISDVDYCERPGNRDEVIAVNFLGTANVSKAARAVGCKVVLLSSDHIFPGGFWSGKYKEDDRPKPLNTYGASKISAEALQMFDDNLKIVRTSYLFDENRLQSHIYRIGNDYRQEEYPTFIRRTFMYIPHFVKSLMVYLQRIDEMPPILHLSGCDSVSWYEFMLDLAKVYGYSENLVLPRKKDLTNGFAPRGKNLGLNTSLSMKLGFHKYSYLDGLRDMRND